MDCPTCSARNAEAAEQCGTCGAALPGQMDPHLLPPGTLLQDGTYILEQCLGHGGFGITYRATDQRLRRQVAIKECFPSGCARLGRAVRPGGSWTPESFREGRERFFQEGQALARFDHPDIVRVFAAFEENETAYIVMEYLQGRTLEAVLHDRGGRLPASEALACAAKVGAALEVVHATGLLHRDIKPANVMVVGGGAPLDDLRVVLVDFGTAREFAIGVRQTQSVELTPGYAPLEQYSRRAPRGPYTDVYALAALLHHMITGTPPPDAQDRVYGCALADLREADPRVSEVVAAAIVRGLSLDARQRPQSVEGFLEELAGRAPPALDGGAPGSNQGPGDQEREDPVPGNVPHDRRMGRPSPVRGAGQEAQQGGGWAARNNESRAGGGGPSAKGRPAAGGGGPSDKGKPAAGGGGPSDKGRPAASRALVTGRRRRAILLILVLGTIVLAASVWMRSGGPSSPWLRWRPGARLTAARVPPGLRATETNSHGYQEFVNKKDQTVLIYVPGGTFPMGSNETSDERPRHDVTLPPYFIARTPVTNAQFARFTWASGYDAGTRWKECAARWGDPAPVVCVNWNDAVAYCEWAGLRLPTEEEWEFSARGPQGLNYPWGNEWEPSRVRDSSSTADSGPPAAGSHVANSSPFGCLDMTGSVWQWTSSWYDRYPGNTEPNDMVGRKVRVSRGGSWRSDEARDFRGAYRGWYYPERRDDNDGGFRCALGL